MRATLLTGAAWLALIGAAQAQSFTDDGVTLGVLTDMSGAYADLAGQGSVVAAQMAVEDFGGAINGQPIKILFGDHQNKADIAGTISREWIDTQGADMIVDLTNSAAGLAAQSVGREKGKVIINTGAGTTELTNAQCSPTGIHYVYDTYALAVGTGRTLVEEGFDSWFFITADYAFGESLEANTTRAVEAAGGSVVGAVRSPFPTQDFSSYLLQAQASGSKVIGLANAGADTVNAIKQAREFGIVEAGQQLAGLLVFITDIHALGLEATQGLTITDAWYWDRDDATRAFAARFGERHGGRMPTSVQAGVYSAVTHYLNAAKAVGGDEGVTVVDTMKATPINDMFATNGTIRPNGRMVHDMYLARVKTPAESKGPWDYYNILSTVPGDEAFQPASAVNCPFVK